ncbi:MAG: transporter [Massilia sp.]|nr:transporter [Massilia sp.]
MPDLPHPTRAGLGPVVTASCVLGLLYVGRGVLEPLALALILSLVIAPLIRSLGRLGLGRLAATLASFLLVVTFVVGLGVTLASQIVAITADLPNYRAAIRSKVEKVRELTERPFARIEAELSAVAPPVSTAGTPKPRAGSTLASGQALPIPVEIRAPRVTTRDAVARLFSLVSGPIGEAGLVLVLLVFILLEHESLRDRVVRLAGQGEVSRTMRTLADAAQGVSRFFFSQFLVNVSFGAVIGLVLWAAGIPHAALWGALSGLLRFVPYLGALAAGAMIALFVAAIDPGWALALSCLALFIALEAVVANLLEPKLYGHSSGLSPLAVIVSALFWGALWGPVGLLLSTPLTLCLVVAGRHVRALEPVTILFSDTPSVTAAQRFYLRVLDADADAVIKDANAYLRRSSFARYCDHVLLPGLALAGADFEAGRIENSQQERLRATIVAVAETLAPMAGGATRNRRRRAVSLLDANVGAHLRQMREARLGRWQGSLDVPSRSVVLCAGLASERDELISELLVLALREVNVDARSVSVDTAEERPVPEKSGLVSTVFIAYPLEATFGRWESAVDELRARLPDAMLVSIRPRSDDRIASQADVQRRVDMVLRSFEEALAFVAPDQAVAA